MTPVATARSAAPSREDVERARTSGQRLAPLARRGQPLTLRVRDAGEEETIELPAGAVSLLQAILEDMASGRAVTIVPQNADHPEVTLTLEVSPKAFYDTDPF